MTNFHGICSFPHGGWAVLGLWLSSGFAITTSMVGINSCRFMYIDFVSDRGADFNNIFLDPTADYEPTEQRIGAGLFAWLEAFEPDIDWSEGACAGYSESVLENVSDNTFEVSRVFGVFSVLVGWGVIFWVLFLSCISLGPYQVWILRILNALQICFCGLTFLIFQSRLCKRLVADQGYQSDCTLDQGGLFVISACILWCIAFLISCWYIKTREQDMAIINGRIANAFDERLASRKKYGIFGDELSPEERRRRRQMVERSHHDNADEGHEHEYNEQLWKQDYSDPNEHQHNDDDNNRGKQHATSPAHSEEVEEEEDNGRRRVIRSPRRRNRPGQPPTGRQQAYDTEPINIAGLSMEDGNVELELSQI